jgi:heme exporter protein C
MVSGTLLMAFLFAPTAQCDAGCLTQKIFYFHVPSAYSMYIGVAACLVGSIGYLWQRGDGWDALAQAGAELATLFGFVVLITGPIWARKAWGHYWVWDPRLTTMLLATLIFVAYLSLRSGGAGEAEKKFSAALAIMGAAIIPVIHYSVQLWRGQHPTVISRGGGGLHPDMGKTLGVAFVSFTGRSAALLAMRTTMLRAEAKLAALETEATSTGSIDEGNG